MTYKLLMFFNALFQGFDASIAAGAKDVRTAASASESFSMSKTKSSIEDSLTHCFDVISTARELSIPVGGYISCVMGCPVEVMVPPSKFAYVGKQLCDMGCHEISLGDTTGVVTPGTVIQMFEAVLDVVPIDKLAVHFHDTYGQALSNILACLQVSGLGGYPFNPEFHQEMWPLRMLFTCLMDFGVKTSVDLEKLMSALLEIFICEHLGRTSSSKATVVLSLQAKSFILSTSYH
ncbi:hypothetical protein SLEP1_g59367 [Rubroshorea leprosula]|uniref:hydroxymethylglutaryl-CoA lyase n=1 Tax=Rubroshorea leprosula TaxID=152421 RepID=A0AAV5MTD3_9ROSI|nr:hypothetical protein SLEP1_g59367 [Rubroshorea leprosula]